MYTIDQIQAMTPEEIDALNKKLGKKLLTRIAVKVAITAGISIGAAVLMKKFASDETDENEN